MFGRLDQHTQRLIDEDLARSRKNGIQLKGNEVVDPNVLNIDQQAPFYFAPYGYAAFRQESDRFSHPVRQVVTFYGNSHNDLVLEDDKPIEVTVQNNTNIPVVRNIHELSLVPYTGETNSSSKSQPKQFVGPLSVINEILYLRDIQRYSPDLIIRAIQEVLQ